LVQRQNHDNYTKGLVIIDSVLISGGGGGNIIVSTDYGMTWNYSSITSEPGKWNPHRIISLHASNRNFYVGTSEKGIFCSTDMGNTWLNCSNGLSDSNIVGIVNEKDRLFSCSRNGSLHVSSDNGKSWKLISRDSNLQGAMNLFAANGYLYVGVGWSLISKSGIWRMKIEDIDISEVNENSKQNIELQVFPNPTDNAVTIMFGNTIKNTLEYEVFDNLGERVLYGELSEGNRSLTLDTSTLLNGMYIITTEINGKRVQEKFVVVS